MNARVSDSASMFEKALLAFDGRDLRYSDLQFHLQRLLAAGSPDALMQVLRRHERVKPLPDYAHEEVVRLIEEAREKRGEPQRELKFPNTDQDESFGHQSPGGHSHGFDESAGRASQSRAETTARNQRDGETHSPDGAYNRSSSEIRSLLDRVARLEAALSGSQEELKSERSKIQESEDRLAQRAEGEKAAQSRAAAVQRDAEHLRDELRVALDSLSSRDATIVALEREHADLMPAFDRRSKLSAQLEADLQVSRARGGSLAQELAAAQSALVSARTRSQESTAALADKVALSDAAELRHQEASHRARQTIATLEQRLRALEGDVSAARANYDAKLAELIVSQGAGSALRTDRQRDQSALAALREELAAAQRQSNSYLELLRSQEWRRSNSPRPEAGMAPDNAMGMDPSRSSVRSTPEQLRTEIVELRTDPEPASGTSQVADVLGLESQVAAPKQPVAPALRVSREAADWKPGVSARSVRIGGLFVLLLLIAWAIVHQKAAPRVASIPAAAVAAVAAAGSVLRDCPTCPQMTVLPAGQFHQGLEAASSATSFEMPAHLVTIRHPLAMSTNDVSVDEFRAFIAATGRSVQGCDIYNGSWTQRADANWENPGFAQTGSNPVTCVSWEDATAYADWLSARAGHRYRLPSSSEWEYAARSGGIAVQPWSNASDACSQANVADQSAARQYPGWNAFACDDGAIYTTPAGAFKANTFGLKDMLGNVLQWTQDCWVADYGGAPVDGSARATPDCAQRELRGASWFTSPAIARASYRNHFAADYRTSSVGIRLVRDLES